MLRSILGRYLNADPRHLQFSRGPHGKPVLATERGADALCFNIAHSHDVALCAVARGRDIGVDVERVREDVDVDLIAERFFSQREIAALRLLPPETRLKAFFTCWVRRKRTSRPGVMASQWVSIVSACRSCQASHQRCSTLRVTRKKPLHGP